MHEIPTRLPGEQDASPPAEPQGSPAVPSQSMAELRLQRIEELQAEALGQEDPLVANVRAGGGALMRLAFRLEDAIEQRLSDLPSASERFAELVPAISVYLKLQREVNLMVQLDQRLTDRRGDGQRRQPG